MTSSTWYLEAPGPLVGCGLDAEKVERFRRWNRATRNPLPLVFTAAEIRSSRRLPDPALGLCAAFCCKEAVLKALGEPYEYRNCTFLTTGRAGDYAVSLSPALRRQYRISEARAVLRYSTRARRVMIVAVYLFGNR